MIKKKFEDGCSKRRKPKEFLVTRICFAVPTSYLTEEFMHLGKLVGNRLLKLLR